MYQRPEGSGSGDWYGSTPEKYVPTLDAFDRYPYYFQFTLTGYDTDVESGLPDKYRSGLNIIPASTRI